MIVELLVGPAWPSELIVSLPSKGKDAYVDFLPRKKITGFPGSPENFSLTPKRRHMRFFFLTAALGAVECLPARPSVC